ncbi:methyl-accepting chemotaxis protein [Asticcacaulis sp. AND118]|uniref:methyl-accepting chemotaxis protein n=1 Tax=Asticcacaulis sp. AND118 TaxID=2840468 RepID=UPI001CFF8244|nr:Cache 3/Cache 2 fusion domain-containing protein [Asticcacaulis sp. AND118]UDF05340.1 Cache 3/Cache 2 fusion domain-containing protein [Asticcacaulis sp. AND118]
MSIFSTLRGRILSTVFLCISVAVLALAGIEFFNYRANQEAQIRRDLEWSLGVAADRFATANGGQVEAIDGVVRAVTAESIPVSEDHTLVDETGKINKGYVTLFAADPEKAGDFIRVSTNVVKPDGNRAVGTNLGKDSAAWPSLSKGEAYFGKAAILGEDYQTAYAPIRNGGGEVIGVVFVGVAKVSALTNALWGQALTMLGFALATLVATAAVLYPLLGRELGKIQTIASAARDVAQGQLDRDIPHAKGQDEIALIARAVTDLREAAREREAMRRQQAEEATAALARRDAGQQDVERFLEQVRGLFETLQGDIRTFTGLSHTLREAGAHTERATAQAADTSAQASGSVADMAEATTQLAATIEEVTASVQSASDVIRKAGQEGEQASQKVGQLVEAAERIDDVVRLIQSIASQTNLLALNATIEAARAGEAGKGFAVVATEVKSLANQTAKATEDIVSQISAIQTATRETVDAIRTISDVLIEVENLSAGIYGAVHEQSTAASAISTGASTASRNAETTQQAVRDAAQQVAHSREANQRLDETAQRVTDALQSLSSAVESFVSRRAA